MFFCVPIVFGCPTTLKPEGEQQYPRICPRCHNASSRCPGSIYGSAAFVNEALKWRQGNKNHINLALAKHSNKTTKLGTHLPIFTRHPYISSSPLSSQTH
ncbi:hypothetical protein LshimejAT787_0206750 [Lyophyllum shimeji]|uniref:Uncharacterized protein n=1 Tax=Lyophyllum shimeji TaxID=47721 RepID=A0A9P3UL14_LYOSH|nr:hypothetical protein LshimejAT787_0206750 [Lyophyllum shimeji]